MTTRGRLTVFSLAIVTLATLMAAAVFVARASTGAVRVEVERGRQVYADHCAVCHGAEGRGDGASAAGLPIKPQDLTDGRIVNPLPDHWMAKLVREGGQSVGLSPLMPAFGQFLSAPQIGDVVAYMRTFAQPPFDPRAALPVPHTRSGPEQPIFFSHLIHAGSFGIPCLYCHASAAKSSYASLPSVAACMGCHKIVAAEGNPEIKKLHAYWERKEEIPWRWVFKVPEYARFPHKNHVQAGVACQTCHGRIEAMERVAADTGPSLGNDLLNLISVRRPPPKLSMGWCVECHWSSNAEKGTKAPLDCVACHH